MGSQETCFSTGLETLLLFCTKSPVQLIPIERGSKAWPCRLAGEAGKWKWSSQ